MVEPHRSDEHRSNDATWVRRQYADTGRLAIRISVWQPDARARTPQQEALEAVLAARPRRVIDVGCGTGVFAAQLQDALPDTEVAACDLSPAMVETARGRGVRAVVADAARLPWADGTVDVLTAMWMLYHVPDLDAALAEFRRVLTPGGLLVAATNGERHLATLLETAGARPPALSFTRENGATVLRRHFGSVEQHDLTTRAVFPTREVAAAYLATMDAPADALPADGYPLVAEGAPTVFVCR